MSHSQNLEEQLLLEIAARLKDPGFVLDIGANDGVTLSNTRALIERGWTGCFVEPDYEAFGKLLALYGKTPGMILVNAAIDIEASLVKFRKSDAGGLVSTICDTAWKDHVLEEYWVPTVTPRQLVDLMPRGPDIISIDIEGRSFEVLSRLPFGSWDVKAVCVEHDGRAIEISAWANGRGFRVHELNAENILCVRR